MTSRVRVYIACSLDGFIAGPNDDLSWLPGIDDNAAQRDPKGLGYEDFIADVGALLMGRGTHDVVAGFGGEWPYGDRPVLVATHRALEPAHETVRAVKGDIGTLVGAAIEAARGKDVYLDGGNLIRQALDAGLVDDLVITMVPVLLGEGHPLFAGVHQRHRLEVLGHHDFGGGMVQLHARPIRP